MTRVTDKYDVPQAAFMALFYTVLVIGCGMALRGGWELMGWLIAS